ncbi:hypothetical protein GGR56DRAFT_351375 [Xylariaceae sp. FL0804]|nr:hypothetical protein GGR56DRAFT_351375 [Xylariaceae sp. FL0804]
MEQVMSSSSTASRGTSTSTGTTSTGTSTTTAAAAAAAATTTASSSGTTSTTTAVTLNLKAAAAPPRPASLVPPRWAEGSVPRAVGVGECREAAQSLAQAFASDALARYLLDADDMRELGDEARWRLHVDLFNYIVAAHCLRGVVTAVGPDYEGVALWMPPGQQDADDWLTMLRSGMWRLCYQLSADGRRRYYRELLPALHAAKRDVLGPHRDADCYYLVYLGTRPGGRRRGYARKLIEQMANRADAEGRAMYLESSSEANNSYYAKFGFEPKKDIFIGPDSKSPVRLTIMVREPRSRAHGIPIKLHAGVRMK